MPNYVSYNTVIQAVKHSLAPRRAPSSIASKARQSCFVWGGGLPQVWALAPTWTWAGWAVLPVPRKMSLRPLGPHLCVPPLQVVGRAVWNKEKTPVIYLALGLGEAGWHKGQSQSLCNILGSLVCRNGGMSCSELWEQRDPTGNKSSTETTHKKRQSWYSPFFSTTSVHS